jgi:hypothetical protein
MRSPLGSDKFQELSILFYRCASKKLNDLYLEWLMLELFHSKELDEIRNDVQRSL